MIAQLIEMTAKMAKALMAAIAFVGKLTGADPLLVGTWLRRMDFGEISDERHSIMFHFWLDGDPKRIYKLFIYLKKTARVHALNPDSYHWSVVQGEGLENHQAPVHDFVINDRREMEVRGSLDVLQKELVW